MMFWFLEIDNYGILKKKEFYNKDDMNKIKLLKKQQSSRALKKFFYI